MPDKSTAKTSRNGNPTLVDTVVESIRERIKDGRFVPGQRLIEADLTKQFDVSRGPLREALGRLASEGLLKIEPHRGAIIRRLSRRDIEEIFAVRQSLEGLAARLAAENINAGDYRKRLEAIVDVMRKRTNDVNPNIYMSSNEKFHDLVLEISNNQYLNDLVTQLRTPIFRYQFHKFVNVDAQKESMAGHEAIATAILEGNGPKAEKAMKKHIQQGGAYTGSFATD